MEEGEIEEVRLPAGFLLPKLPRGSSFRGALSRFCSFVSWATDSSNKSPVSLPFFGSADSLLVPTVALETEPQNLKELFNHFQHCAPNSHSTLAHLSQHTFHG